MKIESISLKNFKAFKDIQMDNIPSFCVIVGANGSGKSTIFSVFGFLKDAMSANVNMALSRLGGSRGLQEVRSRNTSDAMEIEIKYRLQLNSPLISYFLKISSKDEKAYVERETLKYAQGDKGQPWYLLDFSNGKGTVVTNELENVQNAHELQREEQNLKSNDILAIKGLAQFERFPAVVALGNLIENWHVSDFHINKARPEQEAGYAEHLSKEGENLSLVIEYLYKHHKPVFNKILELLKQRIPGITNIEVKTTVEGRVLLKFQDGAFEDPFCNLAFYFNQ
jgi:predicted ATPase